VSSRLLKSTPTITRTQAEEFQVVETLPTRSGSGHVSASQAAGRPSIQEQRRVRELQDGCVLGRSVALVPIGDHVRERRRNQRDLGLGEERERVQRQVEFGGDGLIDVRIAAGVGPMLPRSAGHHVWELLGSSDQAASPKTIQQPTATPQHDQLESLERLGRLREQGVLTDAEFEAQKAELLRPGQHGRHDWRR
jgi:Short C-terminal domain